MERSPAWAILSMKMKIRPGRSYRRTMRRRWDWITDGIMRRLRFCVEWKLWKKIRKSSFRPKRFISLLKKFQAIMRFLMQRAVSRSPEREPAVPCRMWAASVCIREKEDGSWCPECIIGHRRLWSFIRMKWRSIMRTISSSAIRSSRICIISMILR